MALAIIVYQTAPAANLVNGPMVLTITFAQLLVMTFYPRYLRKHLPVAQSRNLELVWPALDSLIALWAIFMTGGWDTPFYHFGVTSVLGPSLRYGLAGALVSSTLYSLCFILVVRWTSLGFAPAFSGDQAEPDLVSSPLNPLMIALYAAFLGEVLNKLRQEMKRSQILAAENERQRMARDIHDGVSQTLFMLTMSLETGQVMAEKENAAKTTEHLRKLTPVAQKALIELRNAMYNVEPLAQGKQTLASAVEQLARDYRSATGLNVEYLEQSAQRCPPELASVAFRIAQEALSNACQHAKASRVVVSLDEHGLMVEDNGVGYCLEKVKRGRGLDNIEARAEEVGMKLLTESGPSGTRVKLDWSGEVND